MKQTLIVNFLLSMVDGLHLHLGYEVAVSITHQGIDPLGRRLLHRSRHHLACLGNGHSKGNRPDEDSRRLHPNDPLVTGDGTVNLHSSRA